jgi:hypothetical protein
MLPHLVKKGLLCAALYYESTAPPAVGKWFRARVEAVNRGPASGSAHAEVVTVSVMYVDFGNR